MKIIQHKYKIFIKLQIGAVYEIELFSMHITPIKIIKSFVDELGQGYECLPSPEDQIKVCEECYLIGKCPKYSILKQSCYAIYILYLNGGLPLSPFTSLESQGVVDGEHLNIFRPFPFCHFSYRRYLYDTRPIDWNKYEAAYICLLYIHIVGREKFKYYSHLNTDTPALLIERLVTEQIILPQQLLGLNFSLTDPYVYAIKTGTGRIISAFTEDTLNLLGFHDRDTIEILIVSQSSLL